MKRALVFMLMVMCLLVPLPRAFAWTDDVEGMLMPSPRGEDNMSDPEAVLENVEGASDAHSDGNASPVEWE